MATNGITTLGTRTFLFGGSSGIDTSALIEAAYNQRKAEADRIDVQVTDNTNKMNALSQMQTLGQSIQNALSTLQKNYSVLNTDVSAFDSRTGTLSSSSTTPPTSLVQVAIDPGTPLGSYDLTVEQKALAHRVGGNSTTADNTAPLNYAGTFDLAVAGGASSTITVTTGMSLSDVAAEINLQKDTTGVTASVLKTSETGYQLILTANDTNKQIQVSNITGDDVLQNLGVIDGGGAFVNELQPAQGAIVTLDNVTVTRDDNDFSDLINGVSLTVLNAEPGTKIQLQIQNDTSTVKNDILNFVDSYNAYRDFVIGQQTVTDGEVSSDAVLFSDPMLKSMGSALQSLVAGSYGSGGGNLETLAELGLKVGSDGKITADETTLDDALLNSFDQVRSIFEASTSVDNAEFSIIKNESLTQSMSFALDITYSGGAITDVSIGGDNTLFDINGTLITGKAGTAYEGLSFAYVGTASTTVNVSFSQGVADMMSNTLNNYTDVVGGLIQGEKTRLDDQNSELGDRAQRVLDRAAEYRDRLIDKYAKFEQQMAAAQTILAQIQAVLNISNNNNN